ncbi:uroporphyrinogen-III C-methyltransferase [Arthrobacter sp. JZ12]|uniref:uroporphyrinogen-III C-methyltransferase n=1 Tax=Arthrobacter sp. JZ12 TaxID=2654190 RepID=UPI002B4662D9|nr:uroporphyrinogen-III C-methyltransferase [Arthrobacter sp. JZ12]WRH24491.1 uroporphyrinogen-III C-methyltransferase [Arthrobacter sp. JZ12]
MSTELTLDVTGLTVLIAGTTTTARQAVRRYGAGGAIVRRVADPEQFHPRMLDAVSLAVVVSGTDPVREQCWEGLLEACRERRILTTREEGAAPGGRVTLIGGGPGVEDLLTVRAKQALREADVVLHDRLGPYRTLPQLAPGAELVDVGKTPGHHPVSQTDIEKLMVAKARQGHNVVRLKGGDPFVFGRGGEEVNTCLAEGIPVTTVPGISSSIAVPAAAGIPVTYRGVAHAFTVVSGHQPLTDQELDALAKLGGTIVVLMGIGTLPQLTSGLRKAGLASTVPVAIVEKGYSPEQRTTISNLGEAVTAAGLARCTSPAVVVIGEVVRQHQDFRSTLEQVLTHPLVTT